MPRTTRAAAVIAVIRALRATPGGPDLRARLASVPRWVRATLSGDYTGTSRGRLGLLVAAVLYIVSPLDLIPDVVPLFGLADDAAVLAWIAAALLGDTDAYLRWERTRGPASPDGDVVDGFVVR